MPGDGFIMTVNNVTIKNFVVQNASLGIVISQVSGYHIVNNVIQDNAAGVLIGASLTSSVMSSISGNMLVDNAIVSSFGARNVTISKNLFSGNAATGISINGTNQSKNVQILNNRFANAGGISLVNATTSKIDGNTIVNPFHIGILLGGTVTNSDVSGNTLIETASVITGAIVLNESLDPVPNTGITISGNTISGL